MKRVEAIAQVAVVHSPWWAVSAAIAGMIVGYLLVAGPTAFSADTTAVKCPCADGACEMRAAS